MAKYLGVYWFGIIFATTALFSINLTYGKVEKLKKTVKIKWGLLDTTATVGKLFNYTIPADAFVGNILFYQVLEAGMDELPSWLTWDNKSSTLYGVADEEDLGPHYISVTAYGAPINDTHTSLAKDVFTIDVRHETQTSFKHSSLRWDECETNDPTVVTASLLLDVPLRSLKPKEKLFVISKTSEILNFDNTDVAPRLRLLTYDYLSTFHKRDILSSSVTNVDVKNRKNAVLVIFLACGSTVSKSAASFIKNLQTKIDDGRFSAALMNFRVLDLEIASGKVVVRKKRRQASQVNPSGSFGQTTIEVETPPIPTRPAVTVVRISTTTTFRPLHPPTTTSRPTHVASRRPGGRRTTTPTRRPTTPRPTTTVAPITTATTIRTTTSTTRPTTTTTTTARPTTTVTTVPPTKKPGDERPELKYSLSSITCYKGVICEHYIPKYTFLDKEDGDTTKLTLELRLLDKSAENWLRLDSKSQTLTGLPRNVGKWAYDLTAYDSSRNGVTDAFEVIVKEKSTDVGEFNHEFRIALHSDYKKFTLDKQILFLKRLAYALGDSEVSHITLTDVKPGSTVVYWSNNSLPTDYCAYVLINETLTEMQTTTFQDRLGDEFPYKSSGVDFKGNCLDKKLLESPGITVKGDFTTKTPDKMPKSDDNFIVATVLPVIIITVLLLVAIIVACILYTRNKKNKGSSDESRSEFVSKGVPVIFSDEVDAEKESMAASPMLLKDEKPPLPPPDFQQTNGGGGEKFNNFHHQPTSQPSTLKSTTFGKPKMNTVEETELTSRPLLQDFDENPLYRPPPPFEPSRVDSRSPRPKHASPQQREPPPYVPP